MKLSGSISPISLYKLFTSFLREGRSLKSDTLEVYSYTRRSFRVSGTISVESLELFFADLQPLFIREILEIFAFVGKATHDIFSAAHKPPPWKCSSG